MITLNLIRGTTAPFTFVVTQSGSAVNLTGKELVFVASSNPQMVKKTGTPSSGFVVTDASAGTAVLTLTVAETRAFTPNTAKFTIELWESSGAAQTLIVEGDIVCRSVVNVDA